MLICRDGGSTVVITLLRREMRPSLINENDVIVWARFDER